MKIKNRRGVLSRAVISQNIDKCAPPSDKYHKKFLNCSERTALCVLRGSMTVEASLILPFVLMILFAFCLFFSHDASAVEAKAFAAAEAKNLGAVFGSLSEEGTDITIDKTKAVKGIWINPFFAENEVTERAVCRRWVGFVGLESGTVEVYVTPTGSVYHLYADCTHLELSVEKVAFDRALKEKNEYGESYRPCRLCQDAFSTFVYITSEGDCYHSEENCSGLKRTVCRISMEEVQGRRACIRCTSRKE